MVSPVPPGSGWNKQKTQIPHPSSPGTAAAEGGEGGREKEKRARERERKKDSERKKEKERREGGRREEGGGRREGQRAVYLCAYALARGDTCVQIRVHNLKLYQS